MSVIAVTGATGFVGGRLLAVAAKEGRPLACLTRRDQEPRKGVRWVRGDLHDRAALLDLCKGASAVIHIAGVISAPDRATFDEGNVEGTRNVVDAARAEGAGRVVHVSSLAAREPSLTQYGASKAASEEVVARSGLAHAIVRPPAVYGPGDRETLELFKMARRGVVMLPPHGRMSAIHADDLAALLLALADGKGDDGALYEPDDGSGGYTHKAFAHLLARSFGRSAVTLSMPATALRIGARIDRLARRNKAKLTPDRARMYAHPDWTTDADRQPPRDVWQPVIPTQQGLADTARWYEEKGWL